MTPGSNCLVLWSDHDGVARWHKAIIREINGRTATVIWEEGGLENIGIPLRNVIVINNISTIQREVNEVKKDVSDVKSLLVDHINWSKNVIGTGFRRLMTQKNNNIANVEHVVGTMGSKLDAIKDGIDSVNTNIQNQKFFDEGDLQHSWKSLQSSLGSVHGFTSTEDSDDVMTGEVVNKKKYRSTNDLYSNEKLHRY